MNKFDLVTVVISFISLTVPLVETVRSLYNNKDEYIKRKLERKQIQKSIICINNDPTLSVNDADINILTEDDYKIKLYWYCHSVISKLTYLYPKCHFCISIKLISKDTVSTVLTTGDELFIDDSVHQIKDSTEYETILKKDYAYFFVTDLYTFDKKKQEYIASDPEWKFKYNTSMVFPIKKTNKDKNKIIGFICINSPQILRKKEKNNLIIKLIEDTSSNIAQILENCTN